MRRVVGKKMWHSHTSFCFPSLIQNSAPPLTTVTSSHSCVLLTPPATTRPQVRRWARWRGGSAASWAWSRPKTRGASGRTSCRCPRRPGARQALELRQVLPGLGGGHRRRLGARLGRQLGGRVAQVRGRSSPTISFGQSRRRRSAARCCSCGTSSGDGCSGA